MVRKRSEFIFMNEQNRLDMVNNYKYLGVSLDYNVTGDVLASAGGRAVMAVMNKTMHFGNSCTNII